jgi:hypothetical protein
MSCLSSVCPGKTKSIQSDVGIEPIGNGYFYVARDFDDYSSGHKQEAAILELHRWPGEGASGFEQVIR